MDLVSGNLPIKRFLQDLKILVTVLTQIAESLVPKNSKLRESDHKNIIKRRLQSQLRFRILSFNYEQNSEIWPTVHYGPTLVLCVNN